jgi:hypothetical protein
MIPDNLELTSGVEELQLTCANCIDEHRMMARRHAASSG